MKKASKCNENGKIIGSSAAYKCGPRLEVLTNVTPHRPPQAKLVKLKINQHGIRDMPQHILVTGVLNFFPFQVTGALNLLNGTSC